MHFMRYGMFTEIQLERYAEVLLWGLKTARKGSLNQGEIFLVRYNLPAIKLAEVLQARLLDMG
jgi:aminopeptidase